MPTYTDAASVRAYTAPSGVDAELPDPGADEAALNALIEIAERDVDRLLAAVAPADRTAAGLKLDPLLLEASQVEALSRATCAAVEWRVLTSEDDLVGAEDAIAAGGGFSFGAIPRPPGPKVAEELSGFNFAWRSGYAASPPEPEDEFEQ
jgi:hypothetical protein